MTTVRQFHDQQQREIEAVHSSLVHTLEAIHARMTALGENDMGVVNHRLAARFHRCTDRVGKLAAAVRQENAEMFSTYHVVVRYRTSSGCNACDVKVVAPGGVEEALSLACAKVRRRRGVVKVDGGEWRA